MSKGNRGHSQYAVHFEPGSFEANLKALKLWSREELTECIEFARANEDGVLSEEFKFQMIREARAAMRAKGMNPA